MKSFLVKWRWNNEDNLTTTVVDVRGLHWKQYNGESKIEILQRIIRDTAYPQAILDMLVKLKELQRKKHKVIKEQKYEEGASLRDDEKELSGRLEKEKEDWKSSVLR